MTEKDLVETDTPDVLIRNGVDAIDLFILHKLNDKTYGWKELKKEFSSQELELMKKMETEPWYVEAASPSAIHDMINAELGEYITRKFTRPEVEKRIEALAQKELLRKTHAICVDPVKLFSNLFLLYIKIPIAVQSRNTEIGWLDAVEKLWKADKTWRDQRHRGFDLARLIGVIEGTGEYDVALLVFTNDMQKVSSFLEKLQREGYIEKSMTQRIWSPGGLRFDPVSLPDFFSYVSVLDKHKMVLDGFEKISARRMPKPM